MLQLKPSYCVIVLFAAAVSVAVLIFFIAALSVSVMLFACVSAIVFGVWRAHRYWSSQMGILYFGETGVAWCADKSTLEPMELVAVSGWSDWILRVRLTSAQGPRRSNLELMILPDNSSPQDRRALRCYLYGKV